MLKTEHEVLVSLVFVLLILSYSTAPTFYCKITRTKLTTLVQVLKWLMHGEINAQNCMGLTNLSWDHFPLKCPDK